MLCENLVGSDKLCGKQSRKRRTASNSFSSVSGLFEALLARAYPTSARILAESTKVGGPLRESR